MTQGSTVDRQPKATPTPTAKPVQAKASGSKQSVQLKAGLAGLDFASQEAALAPVQAKGDASGAVHAHAERGVQGGGGPLPHGDRIQQAFGRHDVSKVNAHTGAEAQGACEGMGAEAYATGSDIAFGKSPDLHTAAHEAAHVVQQRGGVQLKGGVGAAGDAYEQHADQVADAVVKGHSAEGLLDQKSGGGGGAPGVQKKDNGKTGGKTTIDDFAKGEGVKQGDVDKAGADVKSMNKMTLAQMQAYLGGTAKPLGPRSTKEMLGAIMSGVLPRWVARVGAKANFDAGSFGYASANQVFATEPSDVVGLGAAEALVKVGWTPAQLGGQVGKEIGLCVLDTEKAVPNKNDATKNAAPGVQEMNWKTLAAAAMDETKNAYFHSQLKKFVGPTAGALTKADLPKMFELAAKTPVGAKPDTTDVKLQEQYEIFRKAIDGGLSASKLFSGMGATVSEKGQLGAREVMVTNNDSGFKLTADNSVITSLGVLKQADVDKLL
ncbi:MAG: DUF4157 domain-containing protein [Deltaproteobacteria bacterium]|nr:DUF4157 domain-containing protein [Deltaproteobacteria bacterium]